MKKIISILFVFTLLLMAGSIGAHQPRLVESGFTVIKNPEISQAFYGELKGKPDYYQIQAEAPIKLYVGILVPDVENIGKDVSVEISKDNEFYYLLDGENFEWQAFYEEFAGDDYFKGPELSADKENSLPQGVKVETGIYTLKVFSPDNRGKYVLVVGEKEEFPLNEMLNTLFSLPRLKKFFGKSPWQVLTAPIVFRFIVLPLILLIILILAAFFFVKRRKN